MLNHNQTMTNSSILSNDERRSKYHIGTHTPIANGMREALAMTQEGVKLMRQVKRVLAREGEYRDNELARLRRLVSEEMPHLNATEG